MPSPASKGNSALKAWKISSNSSFDTGLPLSTIVGGLVGIIVGLPSPSLFSKGLSFVSRNSSSFSLHQKFLLVYNSDSEYTFDGKFDI